MAEERGRAWKYHVSPYKAGCRIECHASKPPIVQKKTATLDPCGLCRYTDYIPPRNILGGASKRGTPFLTSSVCTVPSGVQEMNRQVDQVCSLAVFSSASGTGFLGFLLVSQTCLVKSQVKVPIPVSGAWRFSRTYSWWLWCSQVVVMHIDEREKSRVQECTRELSSSAFIWPHINSIHEFFSVPSRSLQTKSNRYPDVGIGRKQRKKELEEHHSDPAVLPMAFKYLI